MQILVHSMIQERNLSHGNTWGDYLTDSVFHGLRSLLGDQVTDSPYMWHQYKSEKEADAKRFYKLHGRGFTLWGLLSDVTVDRLDIARKVATRFYDLVIIGGHCTATKEEEYQAVKSFSRTYPKSKLFFLDGSDKSDLNTSVLDMVTYFKREKVDNVTLPISFSIPKEKVISEVPQKIKVFSLSKPDGVYHFEKEADYYQDYQESYFGLTFRKGGWDTMRSLEIIANGCLPHFWLINECPPLTMTTYPKQLCCKINEIYSDCFDKNRIDFDTFSVIDYQRLAGEALAFTREKLTTEATAKYLMEIHGGMNH